jgi:hypothetical protein
VSTNQNTNFFDWKAQYAWRVKLMAGIKTIEAANGMLPHDDILREQWKAGDDPNDAASDEVGTWQE